LIISKILQKHNLVEVYSNEKLLFFCTSNFITDNRLFTGYDISNVEDIKYKATLSLIESKTIEFCASKLVNTHKALMQIKKYEMKWGIKLNEEDIHAIIEKLHSLYLLNEKLYLKSKIEKYLNLKKGKEYIVQKLKQEGAKSEEIETLFHSLDLNHQMEENLNIILQKKKNILEKKYSGYELKKRLITFGMSNGYSSQQIKAFL